MPSRTMKRDGMVHKFVVVDCRSEVLSYAWFIAVAVGSVRQHNLP